MSTPTQPFTNSISPTTRFRKAPATQPGGQIEQRPSVRGEPLPRPACPGQAQRGRRARLSSTLSSRMSTPTQHSKKFNIPTTRR